MMGMYDAASEAESEAGAGGGAAAGGADEGGDTAGGDANRNIDVFWKSSYVLAFRTSSGRRVPSQEDVQNTSIFLYENSILHAWTKCTFGSILSLIPILIAGFRDGERLLHVMIICNCHLNKLYFMQYYTKSNINTENPDLVIDKYLIQHINVQALFY
jgi:hypothetical protein